MGTQTGLCTSISHTAPPSPFTPLGLLSEVSLTPAPKLYNRCPKFSNFKNGAYGNSRIIPKRLLSHLCNIIICDGKPSPRP